MRHDLGTIMLASNPVGLTSIVQKPEGPDLRAVGMSALLGAKTALI
jgi:hypothetical protein